MTLIATGEGWLYLAGVIDAYSRRLIGWAMGQEHNAELVNKPFTWRSSDGNLSWPGASRATRGSEYAEPELSRTATSAQYSD